MAETVADPTDDMKEWLELYLHEKRGSVIGNMRNAWRSYESCGVRLLYEAGKAGRLLTRAKHVLEHFDESWEDWVAAAHRAEVVQFDVEQAARLIALNGLDNRVGFEGWIREPGDSVATFAIKNAPCEALR